VSQAPPSIVNGRQARSDRLPAPLSTRLAAGTLAFLALAVLTIGALIRPDPSGMGTHRQLGLPPCGWLAASGYPCPTCGMTTSFSAAAHVQARAAFHAQPFGALLALGTAVFFWGSLHVAVFGSQLARVCERLLMPRVLWPVCALFLACWVYKCWQVRSGG
jgi:hypothetical protein